MIKYKFTENEVYSQFFSFEVLNYYDSITTDENFEWIEKYFDVLMKDENITAEKFNVHHIRPCCTFKTNSRTKRMETKPLADKFNGNLIKLSVYNHLFAHFYLWKIFNNKDLKIAFQRMSGQGKYINNLIEEELKDIAKLKEECAKKNQTEEEKKEYISHYNNTHKKEHDCYRKINHSKILEKQRNYRKNNHDKILEQGRNYYKNNSESIKNRMHNYRKINREKLNKQNNEWRKNNKDRVSKMHKKYGSKKCIDPIRGDECTLNALRCRAKRNKELYKDIIYSNCII